MIDCIFCHCIGYKKGSVIRETSQQCIHSSVMVGKWKPSKAWAPEAHNGVLHNAS